MTTFKFFSFKETGRILFCQALRANCYRFFNYSSKEQGLGLAGGGGKGTPS